MIQENKEAISDCYLLFTEIANTGMSDSADRLLSDDWGFDDHV